MFNILIVDDEQVIRDLLKRLIASIAHVNVFTAENGFKALQIAQQGNIDLVFQDIRMAGIDGLKTYQELKNINPDLECVFMTGYAIEESLLERTKPGTICLRKPFDDIRQLKAVVAKIIEESRFKESAASAGKDRQAYKRVEINLQVGYRIKGEDKPYVFCLSKDLTPTGIRLILQDYFAKGTVLEMVMQIPGGASEIACEATGEVTWNIKCEDNTAYYVSGIKFLDISLAKLAGLVIEYEKNTPFKKS